MFKLTDYAKEKLGDIVKEDDYTVRVLQRKNKDTKKWESVKIIIVKDNEAKIFKINGDTLEFLRKDSVNSLLDFSKAKRRKINDIKFVEKEDRFLSPNFNGDDMDIFISKNIRLGMGY